MLVKFLRITFGCLIFPAITFFSLVSCPGPVCEISKLPRVPLTLDAYWDCTAWSCLFGTFFVLYMIHFLPIGEWVGYQDTIKFRNNGGHLLAICAAAFSVGVYLKWPITYINAHTMHFYSAAMGLSFVWACVMAFFTRNAPKETWSRQANGTIYNDWFVGRKLQPRCGIIDMKIAIFVIGLLGMFLLDVSYLAAEVNSNGTKANAALCVGVAFHFMYLFDFIITLDKWSTMIDIRDMGAGFMYAVIAVVLMPFLYTMPIRYLYYQRLQPPIWQLAFATACHFTGYYIFRASNSQKHAFRTNPDDLKALSSIPTPDGRRLLTGGWWGLVRHPNYFGDVIMAFALCVTTGFTHLWPWYYMVFITGVLCLKISGGELGCAKRHAEAWKKYCEIVPNRLIPYIW